MTKLNAESAYLINSRIVAETFDDDTVLIDVDKGTYFSMQGSASAVWQAFQSPQIPAFACQELAADLTEADRDKVEQLIREMIAHDLIVEVGIAPVSASGSLRRFAALSFAAPVLGVFTDLADLIAIDPVHEVDDQAGWPIRPANPTDVA